MITSLDLQRITQLLIKTSMMGKVELLEKKLEGSRIVDSQETPPDLVTMNSEVVFYDYTEEEAIKLRLVYQLSALYGNQISVLAPLGTALLGLKAKDEVVFPLRDGSHRRIRLEGITYQPEASGNFEL